MERLDSSRHALRGPSRLAAWDVRSRKHELGQFLTPTPIAGFMAGLFDVPGPEIRLLDAGAGNGALTSALVARLCTSQRRPDRIFVTAYEIDTAIIPALARTLRSCEAKCERRGIAFSAEIRNEDFVEAATALSGHDLFEASATPYNATILNPPYRKISSDSHARRLLRGAGVETSNLYSGFLALAAKLLSEDGQLVAICPRSFCNGPYFRPFREQFLKMMSLRRVHIFESRTAAFQRDNVLQENIIIHAHKSPKRPEFVIISASSGTAGGAIRQRPCPYREVVSPNDPNKIVHLIAKDSDETAREKMRHFTTTLAKLGLEISTGRVVEFRARQFLVRNPQAGAAPLIYPCHFHEGFVYWPNPAGRKPNGIRHTERTLELLVPSAIYVLTKRFTTKEERRRVVACIYDPERIRAERVGFENHLNYFHARLGGLPMDLAKGLAVFLNSTLVDTYFRQFNGHTQVNATDLRNICYPVRTKLEALGQRIADVFPEQSDLDELVEEVLL